MIPTNLISATVIADSLTEFGFRMLTFKCVLPRIILAELNTHKMLNRSLASSRAIRFSKAVQGVEQNPFLPLRWMEDHPGMQGTSFVEDADEIHDLEQEWLFTRDLMIKQATKFNEAKITKQLCNRLIEPFQYVTALVTGTEWENFLALRAHPMAEIHIADLAEKILKAANASTPISLVAGQWHLPMSEDIDESVLHSIAPGFYSERALMDDHDWFMEVLPEMQRKVCAGRLARISYQTLDETPVKSHLEDILLADRLIQSGHWSPMEHIGMAMGRLELKAHGRIEGYMESSLIPEEIESGLQVVISNHADPEIGRPEAILSYGWSGNLRGFIQYRKTFAGENRCEPRLEKKSWQNPTLSSVISAE